MQQIKAVSPKAYRWLCNHPFEKWTMYMDDGRRWGAMKTNVSKSYNGLLKKSRGLSVTAMVRMTFHVLVDRFVESDKLATALLEKKGLFSSWRKDENVHKVSAKCKKCSCGKWRNLPMPCLHAIKFCEILGIEPKDYVSKYYGTKYYKRTYSGTFTPVGQQAYWPPALFRLISNIEYLRTSSVDSRTRLKNDMDIAPARMA
ncbi:hypothetical protein CQW23_24319 [Capsicum baccatum]|uniref:SWIM-type domain-containing protein n=1 Tax=Capsicum baccatum TaxID=33114 RepID=A0A2G2VUF4_CAPBA|nr:hypothetical protein CQW23_24319 [Capsicum baccatum]